MIARILAGLILMWGTGVLGALYMPNQVVVGLPTPYDPAQYSVFDFLSPISFDPVKVPNSASHIYVMRYASANDANDVAQQLHSHDALDFIQPNYRYKTTATPFNDPFFDRQGYLDTVKVTDAWDISTGSAEVVVAVIDTGYTFDQDDLNESYWINADEIAGNQIDDDGNGFVDDFRGWDFVSTTDSSLFVDGEDYGPEDNDPSDFEGHGTQVSGVLAAQQNNGVGIAGVAGSTKIMAIRAGYAGIDGGVIGGFFNSIDLYRAVVYATDNGADIINMSLGGPKDSAENCGDVCLANGIAYAIDHDVIVVAAAGNHSGIVPTDIDAVGFEPAVLPGVIAVSATDASGDFASIISNKGASVDIAAPGVRIATAGFSTGEVETNAYVLADGTSLAAPIVAGAMALALAKYPDADVANALITTAVDKGASGHDSSYGHGLLDAQALVGYVDDQPPEVFHSIVSAANPGTTINITANISDNLFDSFPPTATLKYVELSGDSSSTTKSVTLTREGQEYIAAIKPSDTVEAIRYQLTVVDSNPNRELNVPTQAARIKIQDLSGPDISSALVTGDIVISDDIISLEIQDISGIDTASIQVTIGGNTITSFEFSGSTLLIDLSENDLSSGTQSLAIQARDSEGNLSKFTSQFNLQSTHDSFQVLGPTSGGRVLNFPNPFRPSIESTRFAFQVNKSASVKIKIYDRYLTLLRVIDTSVNTGYQTVSWDGRDESGNTLRRGIYLAHIEFTSDLGDQESRLVKVAIRP